MAEILDQGLFAGFPWILTAKSDGLYYVDLPVEIITMLESKGADLSGLSGVVSEPEDVEALLQAVFDSIPNP